MSGSHFLIQEEILLRIQKDLKGVCKNKPLKLKGLLLLISVK